MSYRKPTDEDAKGRVPIEFLEINYDDQEQDEWRTGILLAVLDDGKFVVLEKTKSSSILVSVRDFCRMTADNG